MCIRINPFQVRRVPTSMLLPAFVAVAAMAGCDEEQEAEPLAAAAASLEPAAPADETSRKFVVDTASSAAEFLMEAPLEHIHGKAPASMQGELFVDLKDLTKSRGLIKVDLDKLEIFQQKRDSEDEDFGDEAKSDTQNEHMRTWFQISDDAPPDVREQNRWIEYRIARIEDVSQPDVTAMTGDERKVTATAVGDFRLHGRKTTKQAKVELLFAFEGQDPVSLRIASLEPVPVGLAEHDIRPRSAFDKLAQKTLAAMGQKVADTAPITFELTARPAG